MKRRPLLKSLDGAFGNWRRGLPRKVLRVNDVVYFPIPKVANSFISAVFLRNCPDAAGFDPEQMTALAYWQTSDACRVRDRRDMAGPGVERITVLRDPGKRLVSCFLDKLARKGTPGQRIDELCDDATRLLRRPVTPQTLCFRDFAEYVYAVPDWRRERHSKSQRAYLPVRCDRVFTLDDLPALWRYLEARGFDVIMPERGRKTVGNRNRYGSDSAAAFAQPVAELRQMPLKPPSQAFYDADLAQGLFRAYAQDIRLYCAATGRSDAAYRDGFLAHLQ
ncbi:MAG: sulfotransferase family 2 domain-containing protein [Rhodobacteraceae bacterium]|nr:sulfotransferase family 2 domain-containing protein [Paracoccaceae bacterium]